MVLQICVFLTLYKVGKKRKNTMKERLTMPGTLLYSKIYPKQEINLGELYADYESKHNLGESEADDRINSEIEADIRKLEFRLKDNAEEMVRAFLAEAIRVSELYSLSLTIRRIAHVYCAVFTDYSGGDCSFFKPLINLADTMSVEMLPDEKGLQYIFELYKYVQIIGAKQVFPIQC